MESWIALIAVSIGQNLGMMQMHHSKLLVWQLGMKLAKEIYAFSRHFPREEMYGLTSQIRRASVSIPSNIAEGSQRTSDAEFAHFVTIAKGSLAEVETQLLLASQLFDLILPTSLKQDTDALSKMLHALHGKLASARRP